MEGRIKILLDKSATLPMTVLVWVEDLTFRVLVKREKEDMRRREGMVGCGDTKAEKKEETASEGCPDGEGKRMEDDRHSSPEDNGKGGNCRKRDRSPPRDSQGWISVLKR